jgi:hypothetical protein
VLHVESDYYRGWAAFFEQRIGANTTVFPGNETVRVELVSPTERSSVDSGLISVGTGSPIDMRGNAGDPTFVDSYDSGIGPYSTSSGSEGSVRSPSGLNLGGESFIKGDVNTGGGVDFDGNNNTVYGHVRHQGLGHNWKKSGTITEWEARNGSGVSIPPIDSTVNRKVGAICDGTNDLSVSGRTVVVNGSSPYCVDGDLTVGKGDELVIDLSGGNVSLAVTGDVEVSNGGEISVVSTGGGRAAELWMAGDEVTVRDADVTVSNDRSPAFRLFAGQGTSTAMRSQATFTGLLYTPTTQEAGGGLAMQSQSHLYGSAVVGEVAMRSGSAVHYDMADIHNQRAPGRSTELQFGRGELSTTGQVGIVVNVSGGPARDYQLTPISYRSRETGFHYVTGAVVRTERDAGAPLALGVALGGAVVHEPPFTFGSDRVVLSIVDTTIQGGTTSISGGTIRVTGR